MKRILIGLAILSPLVAIHILTTQAVSCIQAQQGGTGLCDSSGASAGQAVIVSSTSPFILKFGNVSSSGGGSGTVTSLSQGHGIIVTPNPLISTGTIQTDTSTLLSDILGFGFSTSTGGSSATTTINGVQGPTFTFTINNTSSLSSITTSSAQLFLNLLRYTSGTDINVAVDGTINFVNTPGFISAAITSINGNATAAQTLTAGTGISVASANGNTTTTNTGVTSFGGMTGTITTNASTGIAISNSGGVHSIQNTGVTSFTGQGCVTAANSTGTIALTVTCISGNQNINFTITGDATGTASGTTSITDSITVTGLNGKVLPANSTGTLQFTGNAWHINLATSSLGLYDATGTLSSYLGSSCGGAQFVTGFSATGTVTCGTPSGGSGTGNLFVTPTSSVVGGQFPFYTTNGSSTVTATSSIMQDATGTIWINTGTTKNPILVVGTSSNVASNIAFGVVTTSTLFTVDTSGNLAAPTLGSTTQNCIITSSTSGQFGITPCPNIPLTLLTTTSTFASTTSNNYTSIATSTFTVATSTNVLVVVAGTISAAGTANTCLVSIFVDGVNQDTGSTGLSNSGITLSSNMDASFSFITSALTTGSHTINLELKSTGGVTPVCTPSISQFAVNTISGTIGSSGSGTVGPGTLNQVAVFNATSTITSFSNYVYNNASNTLYIASATSSVGIGTSTPSKALVVTNASSTSQVTIDTSSASPTSLLDIQSSSSVSRFKVSDTAITATVPTTVSNTFTQNGGVAVLASTTINGTLNVSSSIAQSGGTNNIASTTVTGSFAASSLGTTTNSYVTSNNAAGTLALTPLSWEFLGSCFISIASSSCPTITITARQELQVIITITGYGGSDIASLRFNGDTGNNYSSRYLDSGGTGVATLTNVQTLTTNFARLFGVAQTTGRSAEIVLSNNAATEKLGSVNGISGVGAVGTVLNLSWGGFTWVNTSAQITSVQLITQGGSTMTASSGIMIYGRNF